MFVYNFRSLPNVNHGKFSVKQFTGLKLLRTIFSKIFKCLSLVPSCLFRLQQVELVFSWWLFILMFTEPETVE